MPEGDPLDAKISRLAGLVENAVDTMSSSNRELARIDRDIERLRNDRDRLGDIAEAVAAIQANVMSICERQDEQSEETAKLNRILLTGNGQKAVLLQLADLAGRMTLVETDGARRERDRERRDRERSALALTEVRGKWKAFTSIAIKVAGPVGGAIAGAIAGWLAHHLAH